MRRIKTNGMVALLLSGAVLASSIGLVTAREGGAAYQAPELLLTQGQADYDLLDGIRFDENRYELSIHDQGGFDINIPGSYAVEYALTKTEQATPAPTPEVTPAPTPEATPAPTPEATPAPTPEAPPAPTPEAAPAPTPEAAPAPPPEATPHAPGPKAAFRTSFAMHPVGMGGLPVVDTPPVSTPETENPAPEESEPPVSAPETENSAPEGSEPPVSAPETENPAPEESEPPVSAPETEPPAPEIDAPETEVIYFSRTVVVSRAVVYQDLRLDVNADADLLTGMTYDQARYALAVLDDGGFHAAHIDEYLVTYRLSNTDNGLTVADLERYVWVTAPGAAFDAPLLELVRSQQSYDLLDGVTYDKNRYALTPADPESFHITEEGDFRVMFDMTVLPEASPEARAPVAAVFGRAVRVAAGPVVVIDAPPLVISAGADPADYNLLDGVTARDETGRAVTPVVGDRGELDRAAEGDASAARAPGREEGPLSTGLPGGLAPGDYTVTIAAVHPDTGETFSAPRRVYVLSGMPIRLTLPDGGEQNCASMADACAAIEADDKAGQYTIALLQDYTFTEADHTALGDDTLGMTGLSPDTTVIFTGTAGGGVKPLTMQKPDMTLKLPTAPGGDAAQGPRFVLQNISLRANGTSWIEAGWNGLTIGAGVTTEGIWHVTGGGVNPDPAESAVQSDLTLKSGTFDHVYGGNEGAATIGDTKVTMAGDKVKVEFLYGGGSATMTGDAEVTVGGGTVFALCGGSRETMTGNTDVSVTGGTVTTLYGGSRETMTGNTDVSVTGGTVTTLYGGSRGTMTGNTDVSVTGGTVTTLYGGSWGAMTGNTDVNVTGGTIDTLCGGGAAEQGTADSPAKVAVTVNGPKAEVTELHGGSNGVFNGESQVTLTLGQVERLFAVGKGDGNLGTATANVNGGTVTGTLGGAAGGNAVNLSATLNVNSDQTVNAIYNFDNLKLAESTKLTVKGHLDAIAQKTGGFGIITFGEESTLILPDRANKAGTLVTAGTGATLELARRASASKDASLTLCGTTPVDTTAGGLNLKYPDGTEAQAGDKLLYFNPTKSNADATAYCSGFPQEMAILSSKTTGYVYLGHTVTVEEDGGPLAYYSSVAQAMNAIGNGTGEYTVTIRKEGYEFTPADGAAIAAQGGSASKITFTSRFELTDKDPLESGEAVGQDELVTRTVEVGAGAAGTIKSDISLNAPTVIEHMRLLYLQEGCALYANGYPLTVGAGVDIRSDMAHYPAVYGGAKDDKVAKTSLTLNSGNYAAVYGGGNEAAAGVTGDTNVIISGIAVLSGPLYGGGKEGDVAGMASVTVSGGWANAANPGTGAKNMIVGGGKAGDVGAVVLKITGGAANGTIEVAGCDGGDVKGDVSITITEKADGDAPKAPLANLHGASLRHSASMPGTVEGNIKITIDNGKDYGAIHGGLSGTASGKTSTITLDGTNLRAKKVTDFSTLNLGETGQRATLTLSLGLDAPKGELRFLGGSVLNLPGPTDGTAPTLTVGGLWTDGSALRPHLHIHKAGKRTYPLTVTGANKSSAGQRLTLGLVLAEGAEAAEAGDDLLIFETAEEAVAGQYVSDVSSLNILVSQDAPRAIVEFGVGASPQITLGVVQHRAGVDGGLTVPDTSVPAEKTLVFMFQTMDAETGGPTYQGVKAAYVSTDPEVDGDWEQSPADGNIPSGGTAVEVDNIPNPSIPTMIMASTGTVTLPVDPAAGYYYIHAAAGGNFNTAVLDVHSPTGTTPEIMRDGGGDYTFRLTLRDPTPTPPRGIPGELVYTASGLHQLAWSVGGATAPPDREDALADEMLETDTLKGVVTVPAGERFTPYEWTVTVPASALGDDPENKVVYLYAKDYLGNTREIPISLRESLIDVTLPTTAGAVALRGGDRPRLIAPILYLVNNSAHPVRAELVGAEIPPDQGAGAGELRLTNKRGSWAGNELNLLVRPVNDGLGNGNFAETSVTEIDSLPGGTVNLGTMPAGSEGNHGASFTLDALYDHKQIIRTDGWSRCVLSYRFTLKPELAPGGDGDGG